jgi:hypothetical protein
MDLVFEISRSSRQGKTRLLLGDSQPKPFRHHLTEYKISKCVSSSSDGTLAMPSVSMLDTRFAISFLRSLPAFSQVTKPSNVNLGTKYYTSTNCQTTLPIPVQAVESCRW